MYSATLIEWAKRHPVEVTDSESLFVDLVLAKVAGTALQANALEIDLSSAAAEYATFFGLEPRAGEILTGETPKIPRCSLSKVAGILGQSERYGNSRLRVFRREAPSTTAKGPSPTEEEEELASQVVCCTLPRKRRNGNNSFGALQLEDDDDHGGATVLPEDICCICLEPLLLKALAREGGHFLTILQCNHVLHSTCAREIQIVSARNSGGLVYSGGRVSGGSPDLGKLRCPICRSISAHLVQAPLYMASSADAPPPHPPRPVRTRRPKGQRQREEDPAYFELLSMGFGEDTSRTALEASGGDPKMAIEFLSGCF